MPRSRVSFTLVTYAPSPLAVPMRLYTLHLYLSHRSPMLSVSIHGCRRLLLPPPCWSLALSAYRVVSTWSRLCTLSTGHPHACAPLPVLPPSEICNHHVATCSMIAPKVSPVRAHRKAYRPQSGLIPVASPPDLLSPSVAYVKELRISPITG